MIPNLLPNNYGFVKFSRRLEPAVSTEIKSEKPRHGITIARRDPPAFSAFLTDAADEKRMLTFVRGFALMLFSLRKLFV